MTDGNVSVNGSKQGPSYEDWAHTVISRILSITSATPLAEDDIDSLLLSKLSEDDATLTLFEYLAQCWKREQRQRIALAHHRAKFTADDYTRRLQVFQRIRELVISYLGLVLADPSMFPQDAVAGLKPHIGPAELALAVAGHPAAETLLAPSDIPALLADLAARFVPSAQNEYDDSGFTQALGETVAFYGKTLLVHRLDIGATSNGSSAATPSTPSNPLDPSQFSTQLLERRRLQQQRAIFGAPREDPVASIVASPPLPTGAAPPPLTYQDCLGALQNLTENKQLAALLTETDAFNDTTPPIEVRSLLGPFLRLSTFADTFPNIALTYYKEEMAPENVEMVHSTLRGALHAVQGTLFESVSHLIRAGPAPRERVLSYLGHVLAANRKRAAMQVDPDAVSSHGFIINIHTILLRLADPFVDASYSKIDKIDPDYYRKSSRIDISDDTKINATSEEAAAYWRGDETDDGAARGSSVKEVQMVDEEKVATVPVTSPAAPAAPPNFISDVFFLALSYMHIGILPAIRALKNNGQQLQRLKRDIAELSGEEGADKVMLERLKEHESLLRSCVHVFEVQLLDEAYLSKCVAFLNLVLAWLIRLVDPAGAHPQQRIDLATLAPSAPARFRFLPEFIFEDITEMLTFVSRFQPRLLAANPPAELVTFMLVFLSTPYVKNPYLKGQFVEIMFHLSDQNAGGSALADELRLAPVAQTHLMHCLMQVYIQIETTGMHSQFYDKFNTRYYVTQMFKLVWDTAAHRAALEREWRTHPDDYIRFANLLMNDTTYLLDDGIGYLAKIAELERERAGWAALPAAERAEKEKLLRQYTQSTKSDLQLGHESLRLLSRFSAATQAPFLAPEIVDRLAAMMDMNLSMLAGPRCQELKVPQPEKFLFHPKDLLSDLLDIYGHLGGSPAFQLAVAKDGRSYSAELFERTERILRRKSIKSEAEIAALRAFVAAVESVAREEDDDDEDVPDEFLDPLTYEIMRDPVVLPSSHTTVDRSTIKQHFLSDPTDPFNRMPLNWDDLVDAVELRQRIEAYREEKRAKRRAGSGEK